MVESALQAPAAIGLDLVVAACVLTNVAGLLAAALVVHTRRARAAGPGLLAFAVGVLLGAVLLDLLPHLWEATGSLWSVLGLFAAALLASWLFDRACACAHHPLLTDAAAPAHHGPAGQRPARGSALLLAGDFVHSLVDGVLIVAALAVGVVPGAVVTMAVAIHEVPRRVAIVALLVRGGFRPLPALVLAGGAGAGTVLGGWLAWGAAETIRPALPAALALSAAAMLYVALAQSARLSGTWRARVLTLEFGLPFLAGVIIVGGSHHLLELFG